MTTSEPQTESALTAILESGVAARLFPGAVALIRHGNAEPVCVAVGTQTYDSGSPVINPGTLFDMASLTKVLVTTTAVLQLIAQNRLSLLDSVGRYFAPFQADGKEAITLWHLLTHTSGLNADLDFRRCADADGLWQEIGARPLPSQPGTSHLYSDLGFLLLGRIVENVAGTTLDAYAQAEIFAPLGMTRTRYCPPPEWWPEIAPTEYDANWRGRLMQGEVHDEKAFLLSGVAGHAGLFSTIGDIDRFMRPLLECLTMGAEFLLPVELARLMIQDQTPEFPAHQGIGWFLDRPIMGGLRPGAFGHTGFTGVSLVANPARSVACALLTNCVYPTRPDPVKRQRLNDLRAQVADLSLGVAPATDG